MKTAIRNSGAAAALVMLLATATAATIVNADGPVGGAADTSDRRMVLRIFGANFQPVEESRSIAVIGFEVVLPGEGVYPLKSRPGRFFQHDCGATVIDRRWLITAAHCKVRPGYVAIVMRNDLSNIETGVEVWVDKVWNHPNFSLATMDNDVALVRLRNDLPPEVVPVSLSSETDSQRLMQNGEVVIMGWGRTERGALSANLLGAKVPLLSLVDCKTKYQMACELPEYEPFFLDVTDRMLCAAGTTSAGAVIDACQGDSGGPLIQGNSLVGIVSFGCGCAQPNFPGVYSNVGALRSWIDTTRSAGDAPLPVAPEAPENEGGGSWCKRVFGR